MLKDMFIFALRNIKSYRKFFIQITIVLSLILCLCSIYVCSVSAIYDSYNTIQKEGLYLNYVSTASDLTNDAKYNEAINKYKHELSKELIFDYTSVPDFIKSTYPFIDNTYSISINGLNYQSNESNKLHQYLIKGIYKNYPMIRNNEVESYEAKYDNSIFIWGRQPEASKEIVLNETFLSYYNLNSNDLKDKTISLINPTNNMVVFDNYKIVGIVSKNYTSDYIYLSNDDLHFSDYSRFFKVLTICFFPSFDDAQEFYRNFVRNNRDYQSLYGASYIADSVATLKKMITFIQAIFILFIVILSASFLVTLVLKVDSIIYLQKTFLGVLISHGFERKKVDYLLWLQVFICGTIASVVSAIVGLIFVLLSKPLFLIVGVTANLSVGLFFLSLVIIFVLMIIILFLICAPMFLKLKKNDIIDYFE